MKAKLSLSQKEEWQDWHDSKVKAFDVLTLEIASLDKAIDDLVYQLYGLTAEEIALVEGA